MTDQPLQLQRSLFAALRAEWGDTAVVRARVRAGAMSREELRACGKRMLAVPGAGLDAYTRRRIVELAVDDLLSERLFSDLRLMVAPVPPPAGPVHALIFTAFPHVANELYPLLVDAFVAEAGGLWCGTAVAAHADWCADGRLRRGIWLGEDGESLVEADFTVPVPVVTGQVLCLNLREEAADHRRVEMALAGVPLTNPLAGAVRLDNKAETGDIWRGAGLPTPRFQVLEDDLAPLAGFVDNVGPRLVLKPLDGTEGRGVRLVTAGDTIADLMGGGPMLICEERGRVRYAGPDGPVRCTVRLNVTWDGREAVAESGYAQVAAVPGAVASVGCGGRMVTLSELWTRLCTEDGIPVRTDQNSWRRVTALAQQGIEALAEALGAAMPSLVGLDLLLDATEDGGVAPILLEANPRPAGMSHSRLITTEGPTDEPGVSARLWEILAMRQDRAN